MVNMTLTETEHKLLKAAALLLSKIDASKTSEEIDYVLEEHKNRVKVLSDEEFEKILIEEKLNYYDLYLK